MKQSNAARPAPMKVLNRVLRYMLHFYALPFVLVICCILVAAVATVTGSTFPQTLVDDYIVPLLNSGSADFSQLAASLVRLACGTICSTAWKACPSPILAPTPTATSCRCTPTISTRCGR